MPTSRTARAPAHLPDALHAGAAVGRGGPLAGAPGPAGRRRPALSASCATRSARTATARTTWPPLAQWDQIERGQVEQLIGRARDRSRSEVRRHDPRATDPAAVGHRPVRRRADPDGQLRRHRRPGTPARLPASCARPRRSRSTRRPARSPRTFVPAPGHLHRERPGPPGRALPRGVGADRRRPARASDGGPAGRATRPRSPICAGGSRWPTSRSSGGPATTRTGSPRTAATSPTMTSHPLVGDSATSGRASRSPSARSGSSGRPRPTRSSGCASRPARGFVYGASRTPPAAGPPADPNVRDIVYDASPGSGAGWVTDGRRAADHRARARSTRWTQQGRRAAVTSTTAVTAWSGSCHHRRPDPDRLRPGRGRTPRVRPGRACRSAAWPTSWSRRCSGPTSSPTTCPAGAGRGDRPPRLRDGPADEHRRP